MAGHSHFKNIKRKKEAADQKKAVTFSKISRLIASAVKEKGKDPQTNPSLRIAIEKAKEADMPSKKIERAIERGAEGGEEEDFFFELFGPENAAVIIKGFTDKKSRTSSEIKEILKKYGYKIADPGSVKWMFTQKGIIEIKGESLEENTLLEAIEAGAEDVEKKNNSFLLFTSPESFKKIENLLSSRGVEISSSHLGWKAKTVLNPKEPCHKELLKELQSHERVEEIYTNTGND